MLKDIPLYIVQLFCFTTVIPLFLFFNASRNSINAAITIMLWLILQSGISLTGFYTVTDTFPPRFLLLVLPPFLIIILLFLLPKERSFIDTFDFRTLTYLHMVRIPVEIVLYLLFVHGKVPELMTFEGRNFDILSGISATLIGYFGYEKKKLNKKNYAHLEFYLYGAFVQHSHKCHFSRTHSFSAIRLRTAQCGNIVFSICMAAMLHRSFGFIFTPGVYKAIV